MAAPTYDNSVKVSSAANVASLTSASFAVGGSNRYIAALVASGAGTPANPTACKWQGSGGTSLTQKGSTINIASNGKASCFGLKAPTAASSTMFCSWGSNQDETAMIAISAADVDQTTPEGTLATNTGSNASPTVSATTTADDLVLAFMFSLDTDCAAATVSVTTGTSRQEIEGATLTCEAAFGATNVATGVSTTVAGTLSSTPVGGWAMFALPLKPVSGGGGGPVVKQLAALGVG